jgi:hypothetical protein
MWVYDGNLNAIVGSGNDDESPLGGTPGTGATLQSFLARDYAPGTYYLAVSGFNLANSQPSPSDDDFRTGGVLDFPDVLAGGGSGSNADMTFTIADSAGASIAVANTRANGFDVNWFQFTVVPEPGTLSLLALITPLVMLRRRVA